MNDVTIVRIGGQGWLTLAKMRIVPPVNEKKAFPFPRWIA